MEKGDTSFEALWRENLPELCRRSLSWTSGHREDAEDALGQAVLSALQKMPRGLTPSAARGWLLRLVYTKCMDIHRLRRRDPLAALGGDEVSREQEIASAEPSHESLLLKSELSTLVRRWIRQMPPRLRSVAMLHVFQEMRYPEIAAVLAITEANARKRMQYARALLRERLQAYLESDD